jgi:hypothetical protein
MSYDNHKNFAISLIATAPTPPSSGNTLIVEAGTGKIFPSAPFNIVVWPAKASPLQSNAEVIRVTKITTDTFEGLERKQEESETREIKVGDQIALCITSKLFTDIQSKTTTLESKISELEVDLLITGNEQTGEKYTTVLADAGKCVEGNRATKQEFTLPPHSSVAYSVGTVIQFVQLGEGQVEIKGGAGVTLKSSTKTFTARAQDSIISAWLRKENEWILGGDLT